MFIYWVVSWTVVHSCHVSRSCDRGYIMVCDDDSWKWVERGEVMVSLYVRVLV